MKKNINLVVLLGVMAFLILFALLYLKKEVRPEVKINKVVKSLAFGGDLGSHAGVEVIQNSQIYSDIERLTKSPEFRAMQERQKSGKEITNEDRELLIKLGELKGKLIEAPKLEKYTEFPPTNNKGREMWAWRRKMQAEDPMFEYRRPIAFFGKVLDENENPIAGASVGIKVTTLKGNKNMEIITDKEGMFSLSAETGKRITVGVGKPGYGGGPESYKAFNYAEFFKEEFYEPDPYAPVIFRLQTLK